MYNRKFPNNKNNIIIDTTVCNETIHSITSAIKIVSFGQLMGLFVYLLLDVDARLKVSIRRCLNLD